MTEATLFEKIGGEKVLRPAMERFVDRVVSDMMIGFFFNNVDVDRLKDLEYQHAAKSLGASVQYEGRSIRKVHQQHRIMGGQFNRRLRLLEQTLLEAGIDKAAREHLLAHNEKLRAAITTTPNACV